MHYGGDSAASGTGMDLASEVALATVCGQRVKGSERCGATHGSTGGVLARRLRILLANATTVSAAGLPLIGLRSLSVEACDYPRAVATAGAHLAYQVSATPLVTRVSPHRGSTAGGTALTLSVSNLPSGLVPTDLRASIAGIAATVDSVAYDGADATVGITTGAHGRTSTTNTGRGAVELTVIATVGTSAASANGTYEYIDLWSRSTT